MRSRTFLEDEKIIEYLREIAEEDASSCDTDNIITLVVAGVAFVIGVIGLIAMGG